MNDTSVLLKSLRQKTLEIASGLPADKIDYVATSRGLEVIVDQVLSERIRSYRWYAVIVRGNHVYAVADIQGRRISMQRLVVALTEGQWNFDRIKNVSFANKHSLDCRYENLADKVGRQAAMRNRKGKRNTSSCFKGVRKIENGSGGAVWRGQIKADLGEVHLGTYATEVEAAQAYDEAAKLLFNGGEHLNLPDAPANADIALDVWERIERVKSKKKRQSWA